MPRAGLSPARVRAPKSIGCCDRTEPADD